jgi:hypothetical protein
VRLEPPILFTSRLFKIERIVIDFDSHTLPAAWVQRARNVRAERRVATFVLDDWSAVYPDTGMIVNRTEMQDDALAALLAGFEPKVEVALIPAPAMKACVPNAARF